MAGSTAIAWFRTDLRIRDNPALRAAMEAADRVIALYVHESTGPREITGAARWWLHHSLNALSRDLARLDIALLVESGDARTIIADLIKSEQATSLFWNRRYAPSERAIDEEIKSSATGNELHVQSFAGHLLLEPWEIQTKQNQPYSVFTPFWRALKANHHVPEPLGTPHARSPEANGHPVDTAYAHPQWAEKLEQHWTIGENGARDALKDFLDSHLDDYPEGRDRPAQRVTSRLSPHLRFGEISPRQIWHAARGHAHRHPEDAGPVDKFLSELAWRDFNYTQLYYRDDIAQHPMQSKYQDMQWRDPKSAIAAWKQGRTGLPMVDAGMRELWQTGTMHNRVRMLTASFLTKNLLVDWRTGERWFWDCLVDADPANNPSNWQWVAGSGLDASPYFRVFNPATQGERFDPSGDYVRRWVPELADLPDKWIHKPDQAPAQVLEDAGITLDETYPRPIADLKLSRQRAIDAMGSLS